MTLAGTVSQAAPAWVNVLAFVVPLVLILGPFVWLSRRRGRGLHREFVFPVILWGAAAAASVAAAIALGMSKHSAWAVSFAMAALVSGFASARLARRL